MKVIEINERVERIKNLIQNMEYDKAHYEEDHLYLEFVVYCSQSKNLVLKQKAEALLNTLKLKYVRECDGRVYRGAVNPIIINGNEVELKGNYKYSEMESEKFKYYK